MRHPIEKSPRDGTAIILEDDASGTYDVAHWSTEAGEWLGENGEPIKIAPTHWYPIPRDQYLSREDEGARDQPRSGRSRRLASIAVTLVAAALIVTYFRAEVAGYVTRYSGQQDFLGVNAIGEYITGLLASQGSRKSTVAAEPQVEAGQASAPAQAQQTAKVQQIAAVPVAKAQQSLDDDRTEGRAQAATEPRRAIEGPDVQLYAEAEKSARSLEEDREKAAGLALEAATVRKELAAITEQNRRALEEERARGAALAGELAATQRENEKQAALLKASGETGQQKQAEAAQRARSLEAEREKAAGLARDATPHEKSWPRARSSIVKRSKRNADAARRCGANSQRRSVNLRRGRHGWARPTTKQRSTSRRRRRRTHDWSKRRAKDRPLSRWRLPPHEKSWTRARSSIARRSKRSAHVVRRCGTNSQRRSANLRRRRHNWAGPARKQSSSSRRRKA